jgi:hypothetical protein
MLLKQHSPPRLLAHDVSSTNHSSIIADSILGIHAALGASRHSEESKRPARDRWSEQPPVDAVFVEKGPTPEMA